MLLHPKKLNLNPDLEERMKCITNPIFKSSLKCFGIISYETGKINNKQIEALQKLWNDHLNLTENLIKYFFQTFQLQKNLKE